MYPPRYPFYIMINQKFFDGIRLTRLEYHDSFVFKVKKQESFGLVSDKGTETSPHNYMPMRRPTFIKFILYLFGTLQSFSIYKGKKVGDLKIGMNIS